MNSLEVVIDYIKSNERDDFRRHCLENKIEESEAFMQAHDGEPSHIYAHAVNLETNLSLVYRHAEIIKSLLIC